MNSILHLPIALLLAGCILAASLPARAEVDIEFEPIAGGEAAVKDNVAKETANRKAKAEETAVEKTKVDQTKVKGAGPAGTSVPKTETEAAAVTADDRQKSGTRKTAATEPEAGETGTTGGHAGESEPGGAEAHGNEVKGRYVTVRVSHRDLLKDFNEEFYLGRRLGYLLRNKDIVTVEDEVLAKLDAVMEKVEVTLDMFPPNLHITVILLPSADDVSEIFKRKYGKKVNHIAYYSLSEDTIYVSVEDSRLEVIAHEMGHAIVDHYFTERPPYTIHELMAQFAEKHVAD